MSKFLIDRNNISKEYSSNIQNEINNKPMNKTPVNEEELNKRCILSLITNEDKVVSSVKTVDSNLNRIQYLNYEYDEIKRFDEANKSLSDISNFDLEGNDDEDDSEFNSSDIDKCNSEDEVICVQNKIKCNKKIYDFEYENELNREYEEILKKLTFD